MNDSFQACTAAVLLTMGTTAALAGQPGGAAQASQADPERSQATYDFNLPAQALADTLRRIGQITATNILFEPDTVKDRRAQPVKGNLTTTAAIEMAVAELGLEVSQSADVVVVRKPGQKAVRTSLSNVNEKDPRLDQDSPGTGPERSEDNTRGDMAGNTGEEPIHETVVVTGTNIRGTQTSTSPGSSYDRETIDRSGYLNTQDFIRSLPQNFAGGAQGASLDGKLGAGASSQQNNDGASGVNLRGLGNTSTLTLLNGHRMAASDFGGVTDISLIPLNAIERIDVVTDGASAIYGTDAIAGVANFILRKDYNGFESDVRYGSVTSGSLDETILTQTAGKAWDSGGVLGSAQYHDRTPLWASQRPFTAASPGPTDIITPLVQWSFVGSGHQNLGERIEASGDVLYSHEIVRRDETNSATSARKDTVTSESLSATGGVSYEIAGDWRIDASGTYGHQTEGMVFLFNKPPLTGYRYDGSDALKNDASLSDAELKADGTLFSVPGGPIKLAVGGSYRNEDFSALLTYLPVTSAVHDRTFHRTVKAAFAEVYVPLVGASNAVPLIQALDLSAALRHDDYSDFGGTTNPKLGLLWKPVADIDIRASWGNGFRAPFANELLSQSAGLAVVNLNEASPSGTGTTRVFVSGGVAPNLGPEISETRTVGFDYKPHQVNDLTLSFSYYHIHVKDRIIQPAIPGNILQRQASYGSLITPLADDAAAAAYLSSLEQQGYIFTNVLGTGSTGVRYAIGALLQNAAYVDQSGFDIGGRYKVSFGVHTLDFAVNTSIINKIETALTSTATPLDVVNTYSNPLHLRMRADIGWTWRQVRVSSALNYANSYTDDSGVPVRTAASDTTVDLNLRYAPTWLAGFSAAASVQNLFNREPPYVLGSAIVQPNIHYDVGNGNPVGRFLSFDVRQAW
jgi:iron complex outermembrane recepter protein